MVQCQILMRWAVGSIPLGGPIELFLIHHCSTTGVSKAVLGVILAVIMHIKHPLVLNRN